MKDQKHTRKNGPREVLTNLCRSGEWVGVRLLSFRLGIGRSAALHALNELIERRMVEVRELPLKWANTQPEKLYRAVTGADPSTIPIVPLDPSSRPHNDDAEILDIVRAKGRAEAKDVVQVARVSYRHASGMLNRMVERGALVRHQGPKPPIGGQRPWVYEVAP